ncbi:MAG: MoxR family ATPase, partial [Alphaproteobacteria bacterium]|nr:MoxR family ATPase [Alphaproteobacteria bacterium]
ADEINRAPSRVQNSLLEAMEERQITVGGQAYKMPDLFMVMATQNPVEQAGTYALPEAQMDRFLMHVTVTYPDEDSEVEIIRMVRAEEAAKRQEAGEEGQKADKPSGAAKPAPTDQKTIFAARREIDAVAVPENVERYLIDLIFATRYPQRFNYELKSYIAAGASPRGSLSLDRCSRALAWLQGRDHVTVEDVQAMIKPALRHRILRGERALKHNVSTDEIIDDILELVKVP